MSMPKGKYIFGTVKAGEREHIVIPKEARELFDIKLVIFYWFWVTKNRE